MSLFANANVPVEQEATEELRNLLGLREIMDRIHTADPDFFGGIDPQIAQVAVTPDFHKGAGIPIGKDKTVVMIHSGSLMIGHAAGALF